MGLSPTTRGTVTFALWDMVALSLVWLTNQLCVCRYGEPPDAEGDAPPQGHHAVVSGGGRLWPWGFFEGKHTKAAVGVVEGESTKEEG